MGIREEPTEKQDMPVPIFKGENTMNRIAFWVIILGFALLYSMGVFYG